MRRALHLGVVLLLLPAGMLPAQELRAVTERYCSNCHNSDDWAGGLDFSVLGGVAAFGLIGLFVGPVILAVLMAVWREWLEETGGAGRSASATRK